MHNITPNLIIIVVLASLVCSIVWMERHHWRVTVKSAPYKSNIAIGGAVQPGKVSDWTFKQTAIMSYDDYCGFFGAENVTLTPIKYKWFGFGKEIV